MSDEEAIPSLRSEFAQLTRQRIKAAAIRSFQREGYAAATVRQIAKRAGTTHTTFYQYFDGKAEVVVALSRDAEPSLVRVARELDECLARPSRAAVRAWLDGYAAMWREHHVIFDAYWQALGERSVSKDLFPAARRMADQVTCVLAGLDGEALEQRELALSLLFFYIYQTFMISSLPDVEHDSGMLLESLADLIWTSVKDWTGAA